VSARTWRWALGATFAVAILLRIPRLFAFDLWYDEALEGLVSQDVLRGRFPVFLYGQPVNGVADRYLAALALLLLGSTSQALKPPMLVLFLAFLASFAYTTRRIFGERVALLATLLVAVPPYYFFGWNLDSRGHYSLMLLLGVWLLYLAWWIGREGVARAPARRFLVLGLLAGLAWWTSYLSLTFLGPIAVALVAQGVRALPGAPRAVLRRTAAAAAGLVVGLLPLLAHHLVHRVPILPPRQGVSARRAMVHATELVTVGFRRALGVHEGVWGPAQDAVYAVLAALTLCAVAHGGLWWLRHRRAPGGAGTVGLLLVLVPLTVGLSIGTEYGAIIRFPRYLLPLTLALPVLLALLLEGVARISRAAGWALLALILANNLLGSLRHSPVWAAAEVTAEQQAREVRYRWHLAVLEREGVRHAYGDEFNHVPYLSDRRIAVADAYRERLAELAREVDAAERVAWLMGKRSPAFEDSARAAGIALRLAEGSGVVLYTDFAVGPTGYADLDPVGWTATASHEPAAAALAHDRQLESVWRTRVPQAPGHFYQLDLGRSERIGLIAWMPWRHREVPAGFRVSLSRDARLWQTVAEVPEYVGPLYWSGTHPFQRIRRGRVEVRFDPVDARHVRIELVAAGTEAWSMRELIVAAPAGNCAGSYDPAALVERLRAAGVTDAYADHWISANIARASAGRIRVLPSNVSVNSNRLERPHPDTIETVPLGPGRAIVVEACPSATAAAVGRLLDDGEVQYRREHAGGFVAFTDLRAPGPAEDPAPWRQPVAARLEVTLDGSRPAGWVVVSCHAPLAAEAVAGGLSVEVSPDGTQWQPTPFRLARLGPLRLSGSRLFRDGVDTVAVELAPRPLRGVRLTLRAGSAGWCPIRAVQLGAAA
jgi:hypothetical protein